MQKNSPQNERFANQTITNELCEQNEWDSDIDDSNSSEEFMYVRNYPTTISVTSTTTTVSPITKCRLNNTIDIDNITRQLSKDDSIVDDESDISSHQYNPSSSVWNSHEDKIQIMSKDDIEDERCKRDLPEENSSDVEMEWVPSSWSSLAQPSRSALKSPDKSDNGYNKNRRSVVFKKQNYHSVYVYPKEMTALSPAYSEPQMSNPYMTSTLFGSPDDETGDTELEGFSVSSSTRPFGCQFNAQCHTWPTESDFSWSELQDSELTKENYALYSDGPIQWPKKLSAFYYHSDDNKYGKDEEYTRADSGVGESAEILSDSMSLGDLCHTKASLRLPLKLFPISSEIPNSITADQDNTDGNNILTTKIVLPTESMDSLCTNSGDRPINHATLADNFKMVSTVPENIDHTLESREISSRLATKLQSINGGDDREQEQQILTNLLDSKSIKKNSKKIGTRQSDSTDEDSGIESIMRNNKKEIV